MGLRTIFSIEGYFLTIENQIQDIIDKYHERNYF